MFILELNFWLGVCIFFFLSGEKIKNVRGQAQNLIKDLKMLQNQLLFSTPRTVGHLKIKECLVLKLILIKILSI